MNLSNGKEEIRPNIIVPSLLQASQDHSADRKK
jgi:hypothetical protein